VGVVRTPWHAHHIAERHSLFAIIALGEGVVGTVAALSAVVDQHGWTRDAGLVGTAGTGLTFGMWWIYFLVPSAQILHQDRKRAAVWSFGQMLIVTSIVATGAGLHLAAYFIDHKAHISATAVVLAVAVPVVIFLLLLHALYYYLVRRFRAFDARLMSTSCGVAMLSVVAAWLGIGLGPCLVNLMLAPAVTVVGYELLGYRHQAETIAG
jgi:low temperature requirement protein LtrA